MSDWDFLWEVEGAERKFAMETGMTYDDLEYFESQEEIRQIEDEKNRIRKRNKEWKELKKLRDNHSITSDEFKARKNQIFAVEIEQKKKKDAFIKEIKKLHHQSINNKSEIKNSVKCLCFGCVSTILTYNVEYDESDTAICPKCNRKTVIPFGWNEYYLRGMHDYYFPDEDLDLIDDVYY